jgi:hypothetical protein
LKRASKRCGFDRVRLHFYCRARSRAVVREDLGEQPLPGVLVVASYTGLQLRLQGA